MNNRTNIIKAAREISRNAERMNTWAWTDYPAGERAKILMELRHDLESALKSVREMEAES